MGRPRYKLIAIDLDGTLLSPLGQVTPRTKAAVHRCLEAGMLVCFATGRSFTESEMILEAVAHYDSAVFVGGAMVIDTKQRVTLHRVLMEAVFGFNDDVQSNALDSHISRLRRKLGDLQAGVAINGVRGVGYLLREQA